MKNLVNIKLKNGDDLLGIMTFFEDETVTVMNPIYVGIDPIHGLYGRNWLAMSHHKSVTLDQDDMFYCNVASKEAQLYYAEFLGKVYRDEDIGDDLEDEEDNLEEYDPYYKGYMN